MLKMAFDTETSGINPKIYKVLTAYFAILDENDSVIDELDLKVQPDDGVIPFEQQALDINKIDLEKHKQEAITYSEARPIIAAFLKKHAPNKKKRVQPAGHNIPFDIEFVQEYLVDKGFWEEVCHYRLIDTSPITAFFKETEIFPDKLGTLESLVDHFGLPKRNAHNAKEDVLMWIDVFKALKTMMQDMKKGALTSSGGLDILLTE